MDFIDTIFSFIPLVMVILFISRIAKSAGKKKRPKPINSIEKVQTQKPQQARKKAAFDRSAFARKKTAPKPSKKQTETSAASEHLQQTGQAKAQPESRSSSEDWTKKKPIQQKNEPPAKRLENLPELKKAVVWAEILGPPKGLQ